MELALFIWFVGVAGNFQVALTILTFIAVVCFALYVGWQVDHEKQVKWKLKVLGLFLMTFVCTALPSERTLWLMAAGYTAQTVVQSETGKKLQQLVDKKLDDMIGVAEKQLDKVVPAK